MRYLEAECEYFKSFIEDGSTTFEEYIKRKSQDGVWGDDVEIQALSEIYDVPIEIYAYSNKPMKTFHESRDEGEQRVLRLSYHGMSHYNSIVALHWTPALALCDPLEAGSIENEAVEYSLEQSRQHNEQPDKDEEEKTSGTQVS